MRMFSRDAASKKIEFYPNYEGVPTFSEPPQPAVYANMPEWYKEMPRYKHGQTSFDIQNGENNLTIRHCMPFLEGFTSGYVVTLFRSIQVKIVDGRHVITWISQGSDMPEGVRLRPQYEELAENRPFPAVEGYERAEFNWMPYWSVRTPPGYSCVFTHPINRIDLPFYTLGGIVDTDKWGDAGNHPFLFKKGWEGVIEKGTPIFQIIPFKRDNWQKVDLLQESKEYNRKLVMRDSVLKDWYKKNAWTGKKYR